MLLGNSLGGVDLFAQVMTGLGIAAVIWLIWLAVRAISRGD